MTKRCVLGLVVAALVLPVTLWATPEHQISVQTPKSVSISANAENPKLATLRHMRSDGTFEAIGHITAASLTGDRFTVEIVGGTFTWSLTGQPPSTSAFKTLKLSFEYPRGNMIEWRASFE